LKYLIALLLLPVFASADVATDRDSGMFLGGGFGMSQSLFNLSNGSDIAKFQNNGWALEGGASFPMGSRFGIQFSGEYGQNSAINTFSSPSFLEAGALKFYAAKAALFYGPITFGVGYRSNEVTIKSLTTNPDTYLESNYSGWTPLYYANYTLDVKKRFRTAIEAQYVSGKLSGIAPSSSTVKFSETALHLRFYFLFD
jgi:hypothetical protein